MATNLTRINNNQITDASGANTQLGINANTKIQNYSITSQKLAANLTYGSNLTIAGNLEVQGNTTTIDSTTVSVEDPLILLAAGQTGTPTVDIGFIGQRGTANNVASVWDEALDAFVTVYTDSNAGATTVNILSYADFITGNANVTGTLVAANISLSGNIDGTLNVTGTITGGNLVTPGFISSTGAINAVANITGGNILTAGLISATSTITSANTITGATVISTGNISAVGYVGGGSLTTTGDITLTNAGNVSTSGNVWAGAASIVGNVNSGNLLTTGLASVQGNITGGNINTGGNISATGNISTAANVIVAGYANVTGALSVTGDVTTAGNISSTGNISTNSNVIVAGYTNVTGTISSTGDITTAGNISATGNIATAANVIVAGYANVTGALSVTGSIATANIITATGNIATAANVLVDGYQTVTGNITGGNILTGGLISATGNITGGNINTAGSFSANSLSVTGNLQAGNLLTSGVVSSTGNITTGANLIVDTNAYILGNLSVTGNVFANISAVVGGRGIFYGNVPTGFDALYAGIETGYTVQPDTIAQFSANVNEFTQINLQNINSGNAASTDIVATADNGDNYNYYVDIGIAGSTYVGAGANSLGTIVQPNDAWVYTVGNSTTAGQGGNLIIATATQNTAIKMVVAGGTDADIVLQLTPGNASITGNVFATGVVSATGNAIAGNILTSGLISATGIITATGNIATAANVVVAGFVTATGNVIGANILTAGLVSSTGNIITAANIVVDGYVTATGNVRGGNINTAGLITATGNITGGNLVTASLANVGSLVTATTATIGTSLSATGNIDTANSINVGNNISVINDMFASNISVSGNITAGPTGNISGANVNTPNVLSTSTLTLFGNTGVQFSTAGNINAGNVNIINVTNPVNDQDAATKVYVDSVAQGLDIKASVVYATANTLTNLNGAYTYNNGTSGVGATITFSGTAAFSPDGTAVTVGERILVKSEVGAFVNNTTPSAAFNGIYVVTNAGGSASAVLTRSNDMDNGAPSSEIPGAFTFVELGATLEDTGWVCTTNNPVTVGTTPITWSQFSGAGAYTAGAGLSLTGTVFSAETDGNTTYVNVNNKIAVYGNMTFTTPNLANATFTSLSVVGGTGNIYASNVSVNGTVSSINELVSGDISAVGYVSAGNVFVTSLGNTVIPFANATGGLISNAALTFAQGTLTSGNVSVTGSVVGVNVLATSLANTQIVYSDATGKLTGSNNLTTNGTNVSAAGNIQAANLSASGTVYGANIVDTNLANTHIVYANGSNTLVSSSALLFDGTQLSVTGNVNVSDQVTAANIADTSLTATRLVYATTGGLLTDTSAITTDGTTLILSANLSVGGNINATNQTGYFGRIYGDNLNNANGIVFANALGILNNSSAVTTDGTNVNINGNVTAVGNVIAANLSTTGNISGANIISTVTVTASGNVYANNINVTADISAGGNIYGNVTGNISANVISVSGNITGGNLLTDGLISATSTITSSANITGGNLLTSGLISATSTITTTANITAGNLLFGTGIVSGTGNIYADTIFANISGNIDAAGSNTWVQFADTNDLLGASAGFTFDKTANLMTVAGNAQVGNLLTGGLVSATANVTGGNLISSGNVLATSAANVTFGDNTWMFTGYTTLNTAGIFHDTGANPDTIQVSTNSRANGIALFTDGVANSHVVSTGGIDFITDATLNANTAPSGGVSRVQITTDGLTANGLISITGNVTSGNVLTAGQVSATGNVFGDYITAATQLSTPTVIANTVTTTNNILTIGNVTANVAIDGAVANLVFVSGTTNSVAIGSNLLTAGATLAINATDSMLLPTGNTAQRPGSPTVGMMRWNTTDSNLEAWSGIEWQAIGTPDFTLITNEQFDGDGSTLAFNLLGNALTTNSCIVTINGVVQIPTTAYAVTGTPSSGSTITFTEAPQPGDVIDVREITSTKTISGLGGVGTATVVIDGYNVDVTGNLVPAANVTYDLGNATNAWKSLHVSGNTIYLGGMQLKSAGNVFSVYDNAGNLATVAAGNLAVTTINDGTSSYGFSGVNGNAIIVAAGNTIGNFTPNGLLVYGTVSAQGNVSAPFFVGNGSALTGVTATGIGTLPTLTVTGNIVSGNLSATNLTGTLATAAQTNITSLGVLSALSVTANITGGNVTTGIVSATGAITGASINTAGTATIGNLTLSGNTIVSEGPTLTIDPNGSGGTDGVVVIGGNLQVNGNVTYINSNNVSINDLVFNSANNAATSSQANGAGFGVGPVDAEYATILYNNSANVWRTSISLSVNGTVTTGANITGSNLLTGGLVSATGNVVGGNLLFGAGSVSGTGTVFATTLNATSHVGTTLSVTGNVNGANVIATNITGTLTTGPQAGITSVGTLSNLTVSANVTLGNIVNGGSNATGNIGSSTTYFNTVFAKATSAVYADLAEKYLADAEYEPGTVVSFGGALEVTASAVDSDRRVAGVVSTNPSYIMNGTLEGDHVVTIALTGRVPCRVTGTVRKGDLMVSNGDGSARAKAYPEPGSIIGKALADFDGETGVIEVVIGRF